MTLTNPQKDLIEQARKLEEVSDHGLLVSGHQHRTATALEGKGLGTVRYQGPSLGWFKTTDTYDRMEVIARRIEVGHVA